MDSSTVVIICSVVVAVCSLIVLRVTAATSSWYGILEQDHTAIFEQLDEIRELIVGDDPDEDPVVEGELAEMRSELPPDEWGDAIEVIPEELKGLPILGITEVRPDKRSQIVH